MTGATSYLPTAGTMAFAAHVFNEVRGAVLALPVMLAMYQSGGTWMAIWLGICSLAGIALSVFAPWLAIHFVRRRWTARIVHWGGRLPLAADIAAHPGHHPSG